LNTGFDYQAKRSLETVEDVRRAIEITVLNYFCDQLGWSEPSCRERVLIEEKRLIPKTVLDELAPFGWNCEGRKILEVGAGQGAMILELLERGADAYGVEPGREFTTLARMRLNAAGHDPLRIYERPGESLPFPDSSFDYVISLQVLEHVLDPAPVLQEIFRVLKPGGQCHLRCDNYLSFLEPHYRVRWLPLMPETIGALYLRLLGRDPGFLKKYVHYTTYPQIWRICSHVGFTNVTYRDLWQKFQQPARIRTSYLRIVVYFLQRLPQYVAKRLVYGFAHSQNFLRSNLSVTLQKPVCK